MVFQQHHRDVLSRLQKEIPDAVISGALSRLTHDGVDKERDEFTSIYLPLALLIHQRINALEALQARTAAMLGVAPMMPPFIIGLAGSVSVGKSTSAKLLQNALAAWPEHSDVALVTSDGFLFPNAELERRSLMERKGFPESFDGNGLVDFLRRLKSGEKAVTAP
ncbi:MAG: type I pantothenate kinase, partial [Alphaproteobacteria bacterium]